MWDIIIRLVSPPDTEPSLHINGALRPIRDGATTATAKPFSNVVSAKSSDIDILKTIALFCGVGLLVSLLLTAVLAYLQIGPQAPDLMDWI
jgi:hypothetical protein